MADETHIDTQDNEIPEREGMDFDVVIVGAGPAGLAAAIRLKQLDTNLSVVVIEKGSEVGAHILSGAVVDPIAIDKLLPEWRSESDTPFKTPVKTDKFLFLSEKGGIRLPNFMMPRLMNNHGNYVVSLGNVCRWLAQKAEAMGVEVFPGFAASEVLIDDNNRVIGIATGDMGIGRDGKPKPGHERGIELRGKYTFFGEGVRGSLSKQLIANYGLDEDSDVGKYGIGIKELWDVAPEKHQPGLVQHSFGWPLDKKTGGGSFLYHLENNQVAVGFVTHLNYENPWLSPFEEFQRFKTHPKIRDVFEGGKRISYGARAITEGGYQSVPKLVFPGGALIGCSAGFLNVPRIKGSHNAMLSGMMAAEKAVEAIQAGRTHDALEGYENEWRDSAIGKDLFTVRNAKPLWSKYGLLGGIVLGGLDMWTNALFRFSFFGTLSHGKADHECLKPADECEKIEYPKPDGVISFDRLSSVFLSSTNHEEDQPIHLKLEDEAVQFNSEWKTYQGPSNRYCPAGVYEWVVPDTGGDQEFVINAQNCVHCKTCDIKDPNQNINWTVPELSLIHI